MPDITVDKEYVKTVRGLLQVAAAVLSLIGFICACVWGGPYYGTEGAGYVQFATIMGFLIALGFFIVNLFMQSITNYRPMGLLVETISYGVMAVLLIIAGIVAAAFAGKYSHVKHHVVGAAGAAAAFSFFAVIPFGILVFFVFRDWQASRTGTGTTSTSTTTTTTTTKVEATY